MMNIAKTTLAPIALAGVVLTLAACSATTTPPSSSQAEAPLAALVPDSVKASGKIVAATSPDYPPYENLDTETNTIVGLDPDLATLVGEQLGVNFEFAATSFDGLLAGVVAGRFDMAWSASAVTAERVEQVDFVVTTANYQTVQIPKSLTNDIRSLDDLCGYKLAVVAGTIMVADAQAQEEKCSAAGDPLTLSVLKDQSTLDLALVSGRVDAALASVTYARQFAEKNPEFGYAEEPYSTVYQGIYFPKGHDEMLKPIQAALEAIEANGSYTEALEEWGLSDSAVQEFPIVTTAEEVSQLGQQ